MNSVLLAIRPLRALPVDGHARRFGEERAQRQQRSDRAALGGAFELRKLPRVVGALGLVRIVDGDHLGGVVLGCRHFEHLVQVVLSLLFFSVLALPPSLVRHPFLAHFSVFSCFSSSLTSHLLSLFLFSSSFFFFPSFFFFF